ncbi:MAG: hypothetical protein CMJ51_02175 [Planctomycetaceae bacterium]|nr:hypothetical protein [Planctomycetaceae bacterium]
MDAAPMIGPVDTLFRGPVLFSFYPSRDPAEPFPPRLRNASGDPRGLLATAPHGLAADHPIGIGLRFEARPSFFRMVIADNRSFVHCSR